MCAATVAVVAAVASSWDGVVLLIVIDIVLLATLVAEHMRIEQSQSRSAVEVE